MKVLGEVDVIIVNGFYRLRPGKSLNSLPLNVSPVAAYSNISLRAKIDKEDFRS